MIADRIGCAIPSQYQREEIVLICILIPISNVERVIARAYILIHEPDALQKANIRNNFSWVRKIF